MNKDPIDFGHYSDVLFARPSFLEGFARIFDFGNTLSEYNTSPTPELADYFALSADWQAVGEDMRHALAHFEATPPDA